VIKRITVLFAGLLMFGFVQTTAAQGTHEFLGSPRAVPDQFTPKHGIRYNTQGYDAPEVNWNKKFKKWANKDIPQSAIDEIMAFPGSPDAIGQWIDDAFDKTAALFSGCDEQMTKRVQKISGSELYITIMPSAFFIPAYDVLAAGAYYPGSHEIKVLNIYYTWSGENKGWMRHARDLLLYEMGNYFAMTLGLQPEPRTEGWPCNAAPLPPPK